MAETPTRKRRPELLAELIEQRQRDSRRRPHLEVLTELTAKVAQLKADELAVDRLVIEARHAGSTWHDIGQALGVTAQTAHRRYSPDALQAEIQRQNRLRARQRDQ